MSKAIKTSNRLLALIAFLGFLTTSCVAVTVYMTLYGQPPIERRVRELERKQKLYEDMILDPAMKRYIQEGPYGPAEPNKH